MLIAGFYLFYFAAAGLLVAYLPPYLKETLGFSGTQVASISALTYAAVIFIPPIWGMFADRTRQPAKLLKIASVITALSFFPMLWVRSYGAVAAVMALYAISIAPLITLADIVAIFEARRLRTDYGRLRIFGSLGFLLSGTLFSVYLNYTRRDADVVPMAMLMIALYAIVAALNPVSTTEARHAPPSIHDARRLLLRPPFALFLAAEFIHWTALSSYYVLFAIHLNDLHAKNFMGLTVLVAVSAEMVVMWTIGSVYRRVPILAVLAAASLITSLRWFLVAEITDGRTAALLQVLHCFTFATCYVGSIAYMERAVPAQLIATGRALFASLVMGLGGVVGSLIAGRLYDIGRGHLAFLGSGVLELLTPVLLYLSWRAWKRSQQPVAIPAAATELLNV